MVHKGFTAEITSRSHIRFYLKTMAGRGANEGMSKLSVLVPGYDFAEYFVASEFEF